MTQRRRKSLRSLQIAAIAAAIICIALGAARGEVAIVIRKAVLICLECIGVAG